MFHPKYEDLFFVGMFQPLGCIWPGSEQQSKLLALALTEKWKRPSNIEELCKLVKDYIEEHGQTCRGTHSTGIILYNFVDV